MASPGPTGRVEEAASADPWIFGRRRVRLAPGTPPQPSGLAPTSSPKRPFCLPSPRLAHLQLTSIRVVFSLVVEEKPCPPSIEVSEPLRGLSDSRARQPRWPQGRGSPVSHHFPPRRPRLWHRPRSPASPPRHAAVPRPPWLLPTASTIPRSRTSPTMSPTRQLTRSWP